MDEIFEIYQELGEIIDKDLTGKQLRNKLITLQDHLRANLLRENVCPHCGGELVTRSKLVNFGEPPEYVTVCVDCGYGVEE